MNRDELARVVIGAIATVKDLPRENITVDSKFAEMGVDSLDALEIIFELEEAFDLDIPDEVARGVESVNDVVEGLERELSAGTSGAEATEP